MREFWSYIQNEKYCVGCTAQTAYLYEKQGRELASFRDLASCRAVFSPDGSVFVLKSPEGRIAVYSLRERRLIFLFRFASPEIEQDGGICFSRDGGHLLNIEQQADGHSELATYDGHIFAPQKRFYTDQTELLLAEAEPDPDLDCCYLLGLRRGADGSHYFVTRRAELREDVRELRREEYLFYREYLRLVAAGFTEKSMRLSPLRFEGYDLRRLQQEKRSLAALWKRNA